MSWLVGADSVEKGKWVQEKGELVCCLRAGGGLVPVTTSQRGTHAGGWKAEVFSWLLVIPQ